MRTTIRLDDALLDQARREAGKRGTTLTGFIEQSMRNELARAKENGARPRVKIPVSTRGGGLMPGINLDKPREVEEILDRELPMEKWR